MVKPMNLGPRHEQPIMKLEEGGLLPDFGHMLDDAKAFYDALSTAHGKVNKLTEALEKHRAYLVQDLQVADQHCRATMDHAQAERQSKVEATNASIFMIDEMLTDLRGQ